MAKKNILVTGGTGFVGSYILRYLVDAGATVRAFKRSTSPMDLVDDIKDQIEWVEGDILDVPFIEEAMDGIDYVYHAAAMISFNPKEAAQMLKVNGEGTANIVNAALYKGIKKLVHVSSIAALGRKEHQPNINEQAQWENSKENSNYAISKFKAECEVWRGMQEGLNIAIINPSVILGAGYWDQGSCKLFGKANKGMQYYPSGSTGFVDVRDVARAAIQLMDSDIVGERYIVNGENLMYKEFFAMTAEALNKQAPSKQAPAWLVNILWRLEWGRSKLFRSAPLLTRETARTAMSTYYYHNNKIKKDMDFEFTPIARSIQETAQLFKESQQQKRNYAKLPLI